MNSKQINILEFPSNLGLKKKERELEPGVKNLPGWLKKHGFHNQIDPERIFRIKPPAYSMDLDQESGVRNADKIIEYAVKQSEFLLEHLDDSAFQLIIGGDCSILIGTSIALGKRAIMDCFSGRAYRFHWT